VNIHNTSFLEANFEVLATKAQNHTSIQNAFITLLKMTEFCTFFTAKAVSRDI